MKGRLHIEAMEEEREYVLCVTTIYGFVFWDIHGLWVKGV
jgi:hypothetical protein